MYPEDSIQSLVEPWWTPAAGGKVERGRLIRALVPYPEMKPHRLIPEGRGSDARQHERATFRIEPFRIGDSTPPASMLPVAGLPVRPGETYSVHRGKVRPAIVLSTGGPEIPREIAGGRERWQAAHTILVAPFYGAESGGTRGGWPSAFVTRIKRVEYPQYVWDMLPITGSTDAILRLDHLFPIGADPAGYQTLPFQLSSDALAVLDDWSRWLYSGQLEPESILGMIRAEFQKLQDASDNG